MPTAKCKCGSITNSAVSNYWFNDGHPTKCYARFVDGKWTKGCAYDRADYATRISVDNLPKSTPTKEDKLEVGD